MISIAPSMIPFDPIHPFPLLEADSYTLEAAQAHAEQVDGWLGLRTLETEALVVCRLGRRSPLLADDTEAWSGLPVQALLTPYIELRCMLQLAAPEPGSTVVDLGAGYGRMAWVLGEHFTGVRFIGYELVRERVVEANRCLASRASPGLQMLEVDLQSPGFAPAPADLYFLYDFGSRLAIEKTLGDLRTIARRRPISVIGRGRSSRDAIERHHPWLSQVVRPRHTRNFSIYRSA